MTAGIPRELGRDLITTVRMQGQCGMETAAGGSMVTLSSLAQLATGDPMTGPGVVIAAVCLTIRACWKSRDHRANVRRVCATFESQAGNATEFDLPSALAALHPRGANGSVKPGAVRPPPGLC